MDLDETLIHASESGLAHSADFMVAKYFVYCRPGLKLFLQARSQQYKLAVWSSGTEPYVLSILENVISENVELSFVWSRARCSLRRNLDRDEMYYEKNLKKVTKIGFDLSNILILEDRKENVQRHFGNAVYIKPFYGDPSDRELEKLGPFLDYLSSVGNVRTIEKRNWAGWKTPE